MAHQYSYTEEEIRYYTDANKIEAPDNFIYISHLDDDFKYWRLPSSPDTINDSMPSSFMSTSALGRSAPVYTYSNSGPRTVQIDLNLHRDLMDDINMHWSNSKLGYGEDYVDNLIRALQTISVPRYNLNNKAVEPPLVAVRLGKELFIKGVCTSGCNVTKNKPILTNDRYAQVSVSITISEVDPYDSTTIFQNGSFRGVTNTFREGAKNIGIEDWEGV